MVALGLLVDPHSGYPLLLLLYHWNPLDLGPFLCPTGVTPTLVNSTPDHLLVGDIDPPKNDIDKLVNVLHDYVRSSHESSIKDPIVSCDLPDDTVDLDLYITTLSTEIQDQIHLSQQPNYFMRHSELTLFPCPVTSRN